MSGHRVLTIEAAYAGSLMWLPAPVAAEAHSWVLPEDLSLLQLQLVHEMVGDLAAAGAQPDPNLVLQLALHRERVVGQQQIHDLTNLLAGLYDHRATNPASVRWYAAGALDQAIRRRTVEMADRLRQVAGRADLDELQRLTAAEQAAIDTIRARRRALIPEGDVLAA